jgi:hypothetical protein
MASLKRVGVGLPVLEIAGNWVSAPHRFTSGGPSLAAFGNKDAPLKKLQTGYSNSSDFPAWWLQGVGQGPHNGVYRRLAGDGPSLLCFCSGG